MLPITAVARKYGLSRSTLLYYDRLDLVRPSYRTQAGYRLYQEEDEAKLKEVLRYRATGLGLEAIRALLETGKPERRTLDRALEQRLSALNGEIASLRKQQQVILGLLKGRRARTHAREMNKEKWVALLRTVGMTEADMGNWHRAFERQSPEAHQDFLESLGIDAAEIARIRNFSATEAPPPQANPPSAPEVP